MARKIECVSVKTETLLFDAVIGLHRTNKKKLGQFPLGAFEKTAKEECIIAAVDDCSRLLGYLAFRRTKRRAVIVHLCVDEKYRGQESSPVITQALFDKFLVLTKDQENDMQGALVSCRADYRLKGMWRFLKFQIRGARPAKKKGKTLQLWWYDFDRPSLFNLVQIPQFAVLDSNVFFDMHDPDAKHHEEALTLRADWLAEKFQIAVTPELAEEIDRSSEQARKEKALAEAGEFEQCTGQGAENFYEQINILLGASQKDSDKSDHMQLAHAIAGQAAYFVTRDEDLLKHRESTQAKFAINVLRPAELITKYDEDAQPELYEPFRLDGSEIEFRRMGHNELDPTIDRFLCYSHGEVKHNLRNALTRAMSSPEDCSVEIVIGTDNHPIGLTVVEKRKDGCRDIKIARVASGHLSATLAWHLVWRQVGQAVGNGALSIRMSDVYAAISAEHALAEMGFVKDGSAWHKVLLRSTATLEEVDSELARLAGIGACPESIIEEFSDLQKVPSARRSAAMHQIEKLVWPAHLANSGMASYVVAIEQKWAQLMFDIKAADAKLFGSEADLLLLFENAYYRSCQQKLPTPMSRILWYVKDEPREERSKKILAVSLVNEVNVNTRKELFRAYRRYGVYTFEDLKKVRSGSDQKLLAFTFSHTYLLPRPISYGSANEFLQTRSIPTNNFQWPLKLDERDWIDLYLMGFPEG